MPVETQKQKKTLKKLLSTVETSDIKIFYSYLWLSPNKCVLYFQRTPMTPHGSIDFVQGSPLEYLLGVKIPSSSKSFLVSSTVALTSVIAIIFFRKKMEAKKRFQVGNRNIHSLSPRFHNFSAVPPECCCHIGGEDKKKIGLKDWRPQLSELFVSKHDESNSVELITVRFVAEAVKEAQASGPRP